MNILALDTATVSGWSVFTPKSISSGVIDSSIRTKSTKTHPADHPGVRFQHFRLSVLRLMMDHKIDLVVYESVVGGRNAGGNTSLIQKGLEAHLLSTCVDVLVDLAGWSPLPCWSFSPGTIKKWATGSGALTHESKHLMVDLALKEFPYQPWITGRNNRPDDNQCDALWIGDLARVVYDKFVKPRSPSNLMDDSILNSLTSYAQSVTKSKWQSRAKDPSVTTSSPRRSSPRTR